MENIQAIYTKLSNGKVLADDSSVISRSDFNSIMADRFRAELKKNGISWDGSDTSLAALTGGSNGSSIIKKSEDGFVHQHSTSSNGSEIGIDVQSINEMPVCSDFWEDDFYRTNFSATEIAYCSSKNLPLHSFAGLYAAKEALIKCSGELNWDAIVVDHDADGRPMFGDYLISISHSGELAVAVAIKIAQPKSNEAARQESIAQPKEIVTQQIITNHSKLGLVSFVLSAAIIIYLLAKEMRWI